VRSGVAWKQVKARATSGNSWRLRRCAWVVGVSEWEGRKEGRVVKV